MFSVPEGFQIADEAEFCVLLRKSGAIEISDTTSLARENGLIVVRAEAGYEDTWISCIKADELYALMIERAQKVAE